MARVLVVEDERKALRRHRGIGAGVLLLPAFGLVVDRGSALVAFQAGAAGGVAGALLDGLGGAPRLDTTAKEHAA